MDYIKDDSQIYFDNYPGEFEEQSIPNQYNLSQLDLGLLPNQIEEMNPLKKRKHNDEYVLQRFSLQETNAERKLRVDKKREDKKNKLEKKSEKSTAPITENSSASQSEQNLNKDELRKVRNRNSAQLSRDRKKENQHLQDQLNQKDQQIKALIQETGILHFRIQAMEELRQQGHTQCPYCQNVITHTKQSFNTDIEQQPSQEQTFARVQTYSSRQLKTYGLLSLFAIVTILGCLNNNQQEVTPISLYQVRSTQPQLKSMENTNLDEYVVKEYNVLKIINNISRQNIIPTYQESIPINPLEEQNQFEVYNDSKDFMEITSLDQLHNLRSFKLDTTDNEAIYNLRINIKNLEGQRKLEQDIISPQKTLFFNCTIPTSKCENLKKFLISKDVTDIHSINPSKPFEVTLNDSEEQVNLLPAQFQPNITNVQDPITPNFKLYEHGQSITILQVFQDDTSYIINTVKCTVEQTTSLKYDHEIIDNISF